MEYNKAESNKIKDSVTTRLESLLGRLDKLHHRMSSTVDRIIGPSPRPAEQDSIGNTDCLRRGIDRAHELVNLIENEFDRLGDGL